MAKKKIIIQQRKTLLIVGEGATEEAFLQHLRSLYCANKNGPKVTIKNAHGKGPENVLNCALREMSRTADYSQVAVLMDTDIPWTAKLERQANIRNVILIGSKPCIEGLFLNLLEKSVPQTSIECKDHIKIHFNNCDLLLPSSYGAWCTSELLRSHENRIDALKNLLSLFK